MNATAPTDKQLLRPVATVEHQQLVDATLSTYDLVDRLVPLWREVAADAAAHRVAFDADAVMALHRRIAAALDLPAGGFANLDLWEGFVEECEEVIDDDPDHVLSWTFASLYWNHLRTLRFATAWFYVSALSLQQGRPPIVIAIERLGPFLDSLSGSGPPLYDGQTFYIDRYAG